MTDAIGTERRKRALRMKCMLRTLAIAALMAQFATVNTLRSLDEPMKKGTYTLVGTGPGDPDMMTIRAIKTIEKADVIFCNPGMAKRFESLIEGKQVHLNRWGRMPFYGLSIDQVHPEDKAEYQRIVPLRDEFVRKVRQFVRDGKAVVVLDNGDPMIYGPYTWTLEEFEDLAPVVVAGLSSFNAGNAALRKSVTNSRNTKSVTLTATDKFGRSDPIETLSKVKNTMVIFTMRDEFDSFIKGLLVNYPPETPLAIVRNAGYQEKESVMKTTLGKAIEDVKADSLDFEYLIYVGDFLDFRYRKDAEAIVP